MRSLAVTVALCIAALPAAAQQPATHATGGTLPAGWHARVDRADQNVAEVQFMSMGNSFHVITGPHVILWNPAHTGAGSYRATVTYNQAKIPEHAEGYGLIVGGKNLDQPTQDYLYFLIRHDGQFMIRHRAGAEVHDLVNWTPSAAIKKPSATASATNTLDIESLPNQVRFLINNTEVKAIDRVPMLNTNGIVGLRVGHNLEVMPSSFTVQPVAK
jgi:hypothetical protein